MSLEGNRKFVLTLIALLSACAIIIFHPSIDPVDLGLGLGFLIAPMAASNAFEHKYKNTAGK